MAVDEGALEEGSRLRPMFASLGEITRSDGSVVFCQELSHSVPWKNTKIQGSNSCIVPSKNTKMLVSNCDIIPQLWYNTPQKVQQFNKGSVTSKIFDFDNC